MENQFINTGVMCIVTVIDNNYDDGIRQVDIGNYFKDINNGLCVITSNELAEKYSKHIPVPIYIKKHKNKKIIEKRFTKDLYKHLNEFKLKEKTIKYMGE